jgi:hypothetical protein
VIGRLGVTPRFSEAGDAWGVPAQEEASHAR